MRPNVLPMMMTHNIPPNQIKNRPYISQSHHYNYSHYSNNNVPNHQHNTRLQGQDPQDQDQEQQEAGEEESFLRHRNHSPTGSLSFDLHTGSNPSRRRSLVQTQSQKSPTIPTAAAASMTTTSVSTAATTLLCSVRNRHWDSVLKRSVTHPHEVRHYRDASTGNTILHEACRFMPSAAVIQQLLQIDSTLLRTANLQGATPLHVAASNRCGAAALRALLLCSNSTTGSSGLEEDTVVEQTESSLRIVEEEGAAVENQCQQHYYHSTADLSNLGRAPIHYACMSFRGLDIEAFMVLLDATLEHGHRVVTVQEQQQQWSTTPAAKNENSGLHHADDEGGEKEEEEDDDASTLVDVDDLPMYYHEASSTHQGQSFSWDSENQSDDEDHENYWLVECKATPVLDGLPEFSPVRPKRRDRRNEKSKSILITTTRKVNVMSLKDAVGMTPLALLFRRYRQRLRKVITTVDRLHQRHQQHPPPTPLSLSTTRTRAMLPPRPLRATAVVAALTVHVELGELWTKAQRIIAKLTRTRVHWEEQQQQRQQQQQQQQQTLNSPTASLITAHEKTSINEISIPSIHPTDKGTKPEITSSNRVSSTPLTAPSQPPKQPQRKFRIVHASVGLVGFGCPPEMIRLAISLHPHQVKEMDEDGNLPLHIAVKSSSYLTNALDANLMHSQAKVNYNGLHQYHHLTHHSHGDDDEDRSVRSALSFFSSATISQTPHPFDKVIKILLHHYPEGARTPHGLTGQLPLSMAVQCQNRTWDDGIRTLLNAYPPALHSQKLFEHTLYPSVLSALGSRGKLQQVASPASSEDCIQDAHPKSCSIPRDVLGSMNGMQQPIILSPVGSLSPTLCQQCLLSPVPAQPAALGSHPISSIGTGRMRVSSSKQRRQDACSRSTFFQIVRAKPEWLISSTTDGE